MQGQWGGADVTCIKVMHYVTAQKDCRRPKSVHYAALNYIDKSSRVLHTSLLSVCLSVCLYTITAASVPRGLITLLRQVNPYPTNVENRVSS